MDLHPADQPSSPMLDKRIQRQDDMPSVQRLHDPRISAISAILRTLRPEPHPRVLVVGCGSGREAAVLAADLDGSTIGIDLVTNFCAEAKNWADLRHGDATAMNFPDSSFDVLFSYHVLEHIPRPERALAEMKRILRPGGLFCIGTPNRLRLLGYIGGPRTPAELVRWNLADWRALGAFATNWVPTPVSHPANWALCCARTSRIAAR